VITRAPVRVPSEDPSSLPKADSLSIANQSWACSKRGVSGWFWDIGQVPLRNFDWLPFTPPSGRLFGPSVMHANVMSYVILYAALVYNNYIDCRYLCMHLVRHLDSTND
jgi:hypothetical protein